MIIRRHSLLLTVLLSVFLCPSLPRKAAADHHEPPAREIYELRVFQLSSAANAASFDTMMKDSALPALKRLGVGPVGVFKQKEEANKKAPEGSKHWRYVFARFDSFEQFATVREKLASDREFLDSAQEFLSDSKSDPNFTRIDSSLHIAFTGMPRLVMPAADAAAGKRFFELRTYESHSEAAAHLKVDMFNNGEFAVFKKAGLTPVFFGQALAGSNLPQLTYMLVYDNEEKKQQAWRSFLESPEWAKLKGVEKYKDTVSKIVSTFLVATEASQIR